MTTTTIIAVLVFALSTLACGGVGFFLFVAIVGFIVLRRRGKKGVSAKEAVSVGVESVSQVFVRGSGGLQALDDDDDDDDDE
jgi:hypothetical protein